MSEAKIFYDLIVGVHAGEFCMKPNTQQTHTFFKSIDCIDVNGYPEKKKVIAKLKEFINELEGKS